jgi:hypothetical protein
MSEPRNGGVKTLGIKLPDTLHAQFALVATLDDISLGDAALRAVELYVTTKRQEPDFAARAEAALAEIERDAATRRAAIQGLFAGGDEVGGETATPKASGSSRRKATSGDQA